MKTITITLPHVKSTPGTEVYGVKGSPKPPVSQIYVGKSAFEGGIAPGAIRVTVEAVEGV